MALVSVRLFCKNLDNLQEFFRQMVYCPPLAKNCPYAYADKRLWKDLVVARLRATKWVWVQNLNLDMKDSVLKFFLFAIWKRIVKTKLSKKMLLMKKKKERPGLKFNPGLALIGAQKTGPRAVEVSWCGHIYRSILVINIYWHSSLSLNIIVRQELVVPITFPYTWHDAFCFPKECYNTSEWPARHIL